jgi:hypothetical protein
MDPHCKQKFQYSTVLEPRPFSRILLPSAPQTPYRNRNLDYKSVDHFGQRKLLLSEIEFLTIVLTTPHASVLYVGAGPGIHIPELISLFPQCKFTLYDTTAFVHGLDKMAKLHTRLFTDNDAKVERPDFFISDMRSMDIPEDMRAQERWVQIMKPVASLLKFRLPWDKGKTQYLNGLIMLPIWGPKTTTEGRLLVTDPESQVEYDNFKYESQMYHFNTVTRTANPSKCFDCESEDYVLGDYYDKFHGHDDGKKKWITNKSKTYSEQYRGRVIWNVE